MNKTLSNFIYAIIIGLVFVNCANRGTPGGGPKDETPPSIIKSEPENYTTHFKGNEIKVYFDEYIKIKDLSKQLIISPPMKTQPIVTPLGGASKYITIKISDTLLANTTYAFNFGNSITDNNEGNPYPYYRYVFSTGAYIDSLSIKGNIVDALKKEPETFVNVSLYEVDSTFTDSIIYKENPKYITNTLDSLTTFSIENLKPGKYLLTALKDGNGDNKFQYEKEYTARISEQQRDSLLIAVSPSGSIGYTEDFTITGNTPLSKFDASKVSMMDKDSVAVSFTTDFDSIKNAYALKFDKTEDNNYRINILPEAFEDFFGDTNKDTLNYALRTSKASDFGYARFTLVNATYPLIIQLTDKQGKVKAEQFVEKAGAIDFQNLTPSFYSIRIIHDTNGNQKYDTGNYLKKIQPEKVSHFDEFEIRADWGEALTLTFK